MEVFCLLSNSKGCIVKQPPKKVFLEVLKIRKVLESASLYLNDIFRGSQKGVFFIENRKKISYCSPPKTLLSKRGHHGAFYL